jgi:ribosome biogenesis GTPase
VVGDRVRWQRAGDEGVVEHIEPRRNLLFRQDEWRTKSFAANLDQLLMLVASEPVFSESQLTRALIAAPQRRHSPR